jgi:hypothetical protein
MVAMKKQETLQPQKRRGPKPTGKGEPIQVRMQPDAINRLDAWRKKQPDLPSRPEAIRRIVESALKPRPSAILRPKSSSRTAVRGREGDPAARAEIETPED